MEQFFRLRNGPFANIDRKLLNDFARRCADIVEAFIDTWRSRLLRGFIAVIGKLFRHLGRFGRDEVFRRVVLSQDRSRAKGRPHCSTENQTKTCHKSYQMRPAPFSAFGRIIAQCTGLIQYPFFRRPELSVTIAERAHRAWR